MGKKREGLRDEGGFCNVLNIPINKTSKKKVSGGLKFFHPCIE